VNRATARVSRGTPPENAGGTQRAQGWIDLWYADLRHAGWRRLLLLLSDEERGRARALAFDRDARRFIVSHAVLRSLVSHVTGIPVYELKFRIEPDGKPVLEPGVGQPVHFSLSRSEELVLIGFAPGPLGVDIEWLEKAMDVEALADYVLSRREQDSFKRLDLRNRRKAFLQCWTIKEAYLKAIGKGLFVPPTMVEVSFRPGQRPGLRSIFGNERAASRWCVELVVPREGYVGAAATEGGPWPTRMRAFETCSLTVDA
jgi:4'-phosphopantetheinyl transferase